MLHGIQQLTEVFQFSGPGITLAYNYVLDYGEQDEDGRIVPKLDYPRLGLDLSINADCMKHENVCENFFSNPVDGICSVVASNRLKGDFIDGKFPSCENWLCLQC